MVENQQEDFSHYNGEGSTLRRAQLRMLEILLVVDEICRKHQIPYWLDYGTLLGAVRHGGFIPWDDDLDISVRIEDYQKLKDILSAELPDNLALQDWKNEKNLTLKCAKIRDKKSVYIEEADEMKPLKLNGIFIDIFPVQKIPSPQVKRSIEFWYGRSFRRLRGLHQNKSDLIAAYAIWPFAWMGEQFSKSLTKIKKAKRIGNLYGGLNFPCTHKMEDVFPLKEIEFEGHLFFAPNNSDRHLTEIYKDYMRIPPKEKRLTHAKEIVFLDN